MITLNLEMREWPKLPKDLQVGQDVSFLMDGLVAAISSEMIDVRSGPNIQYALGERQIRIVVTGLEPYKPTETEDERE